jgi:hypothetical protein
MRAYLSDGPVRQQFESMGAVLVPTLSLNSVDEAREILADVTPEHNSG